jgi:hypothetical protein
MRSVARFTPTWRTSAPASEFRLTVEARKLLHALFENERKEIMVERVPGIDIDDTEGSMNRLADSICLIKLIARHNDPVDDFHMDEHQVVLVCNQFKDGVTFMTLTTQHLLNNLARGDSKRRDILTVLSIGVTRILH